MNTKTFPHRLRIAMERWLKKNNEFSDEEVEKCNFSDYAVAVAFLNSYNKIIADINKEDISSYSKMASKSLKMWSNMLEEFNDYSEFDTTPFYVIVSNSKNAVEKNDESNIEKAYSEIIEAVSGVRILTKRMEEIHPEFIEIIKDSYYV